MSVIIGAVMIGAVGAGLVWFGVGQFRHGVDRPWSHRVRGIAYATGGLGVLLGTIVFTTGWSGGLVGVLPGLLMVAAFYVGGSAAWLARTVENWQAERARRELGLEPTPWMLPVGLVVALWLIGWMLVLIVAGVVVYAIMGTDRTQPAYEHAVYPVWGALSAVILMLGTGHAVHQWRRRRLRDERRVAADREAAHSGRLAGPER